jgi:hypothetical protein
MGCQAILVSLYIIAIIMGSIYDAENTYGASLQPSVVITSGTITSRVGPNIPISRDTLPQNRDKVSPEAFPAIVGIVVGLCIAIAGAIYRYIYKRPLRRKIVEELDDRVGEDKS